MHTRAGLDHPRWLYVLPNGDVLVAESNGPPRPDDARGIKGWTANLIMERAGAGVSERQPHHAAARHRRGRRRGPHVALLAGLHSPFGMALVGNNLYVANTDAVMRFRYADGRYTNHRRRA